MIIKLPRYDLFGECITRFCTIRAIERKAINLSQGFPEDEPILPIKKAACEAIRIGPNQYADMRGAPDLREELSRYYNIKAGFGWVNKDKNVTITCGSTEAMAAAVLAIAGPGDEVIIQQPTYENYPPQALIAGASIRFIDLKPPKWEITKKDLDLAFNNKTKVIILNNPNNPTGRVYSTSELELVADYCKHYNVILIVDEIYEHLVWDNRKFIHIATLAGMKDRTVTISGISKSYSATGWRVGWAIAPAKITRAIRRIHDFLTATVPTPLQTASIVALRLPKLYYIELAKSYEERRKILSSYLSECGLEFSMPEGAYYFFASAKRMKFINSIIFSDRLLDEAKVAVVPYNAFFRKKSYGTDYFRINFAKKKKTIIEAGKRLRKFCLENLKY